MLSITRLSVTRWKGENVSTTEVTQIVSVLPGVAEANVYGAAIANHDGRAGMAALTFADGVDSTSFEWEKLVGECGKNLPAFARPVFVRIQPAIEITGTFKHKKVELRKEGANPSLTDDEIYYFDNKTKLYVRLTKEIYEQIERGEIKI
jgi:fatty-acyl-CoA synthase